MVRFSQYWVDPDAELQLLFDQEREIKETEIVKNQITRSQGFHTSQLASELGNVMPSGAIIASGLSELAIQAPEIKQVVDSYLEQQASISKRIRDAGRSFVRTAFVAADSLAEAVIKRPFQAAAATHVQRGDNPILALGGPLLGFLTDPFTRDEGQESFYQSYKVGAPIYKGKTTSYKFPEKTTNP